MKRHIVRGQQEKIYFIESESNNVKIFAIEYGTEKEEVIKREVFQHTGGEVCAFEPDFRMPKPDYRDGHLVPDMPQGFYILCDEQKLTYITSKDGNKFKIQE